MSDRIPAALREALGPSEPRQNDRYERLLVAYGARCMAAALATVDALREERETYRNGWTRAEEHLTALRAEVARLRVWEQDMRTAKKAGPDAARERTP